MGLTSHRAKSEEEVLSFYCLTSMVAAMRTAPTMPATTTVPTAAPPSVPAAPRTSVPATSTPSPAAPAAIAPTPERRNRHRSRIAIRIITAVIIWGWSVGNRRRNWRDIRGRGCNVDRSRRIIHRRNWCCHCYGNPRPSKSHSKDLRISLHRPRESQSHNRRNKLFHSDLSEHLFALNPPQI